MKKNYPAKNLKFSSQDSYNCGVKRENFDSDFTVIFCQVRFVYTMTKMQCFEEADIVFTYSSCHIWVCLGKKTAGCVK